MAFWALPSVSSVLWKPFLASAESLLCGISDTAYTDQRLGFLRLGDEDWKGAYPVSSYNRLQRTLAAIKADRMQCECHATFWRCAAMQGHAKRSPWSGRDGIVASTPVHRTAERSKGGPRMHGLSAAHSGAPTRKRERGCPNKFRARRARPRGSKSA